MLGKLPPTVKVEVVDTTPISVLNSIRLSAQEQRELEQRMEKKQMKEFMNVSKLFLTVLPAGRCKVPGVLFRSGLANFDFDRHTPTSCSDASMTASTISQQRACTQRRRDVSCDAWISS